MIILRKFKLKQTWRLMTNECNSRNETWRWTDDNIGVAVQSWLNASWADGLIVKVSQLKRLNGIQWSWVQIPLRPTFYSYFKESFSGEYHIFYFIVLFLWQIDLYTLFKWSWYWDCQNIIESFQKRSTTTSTFNGTAMFYLLKHHVCML